MYDFRHDFYDFYIYIYSHYLCVFIPMKKVLYGVNVYVFVPLVFFFITKNVYA